MRTRGGEQLAPLIVVAGLLLAGSGVASAEAYEVGDFPRVPPSVTLVVVPLDDDDATRGGAVLYERIGRRIMGLSQDQVVRTEAPRSQEELLGLFGANGIAWSRLKHRELALVVFLGGSWRGDRLRLGGASLAARDIVRALSDLVYGSGHSADAFFRGSVAAVFEQRLDAGALLREVGAPRKTAVISLGSEEGQDIWSARTEQRFLKLSKLFPRTPADAWPSVFVMGEVYRPETVLFGLGLVEAVFDPTVERADLWQLMDDLVRRVDLLPDEHEKLSRVKASFSSSRAATTCFEPAAYPIVARDVRVYLSYVESGELPRSRDPAQGARSSLAAALVLDGGRLLSRDQCVRLIEDERQQRSANVTCLLMTFDGRINVHCSQPNGLTVVEREATPEAFEARVPDLVREILMPYAAIKVEDVEVTQTQRPRHVVMLLDRSWSTWVTDPTIALTDATARVSGLRWRAVMRMFHELFHASRPLTGDNRLSLVFFDEDQSIHHLDGLRLAASKPWDEREETLEALLAREVRPRPYSDLLGAIEEARGAARPGKDHQVHLVLMTDGWRFTDDADDNEALTSAPVTQALEELRSDGWEVHVLGFAPPPGLRDRVVADVKGSDAALERYLLGLLPAPEVSEQMADPEDRRWHLEGLARAMRSDLAWVEALGHRWGHGERSGVARVVRQEGALLAAHEELVARFASQQVVELITAPVKGHLTGADVFTFALTNNGDYELAVSNLDEILDMSFRARVTPDDGSGPRDATDQITVDESDPLRTIIRLKDAVAGRWTLIRTRGEP